MRITTCVIALQNLTRVKSAVLFMRVRTLTRVFNIEPWSVASQRGKIVIYYHPVKIYMSTSVDIGGLYCKFFVTCQRVTHVTNRTYNSHC